MSCGFQIPGDLALSADGRYLLLWQGGEEIAHRANVALQTFAGAWVYDPNKGVKYLYEIFEKPASAGLALLRAEIWRVLGETAGVVEVLQVQIDFDPETRTATIRWQARAEAAGVVSSEVTIK
jgi:hypothetical protein